MSSYFYKSVYRGLTIGGIICGLALCVLLFMYGITAGLPVMIWLQARLLVAVILMVSVSAFYANVMFKAQHYNERMATMLRVHPQNREAQRWAARRTRNG